MQMHEHELHSAGDEMAVEPDGDQDDIFIKLTEVKNKLSRASVQIVDACESLAGAVESWATALVDRELTMQEAFNHH